MQFSVSARVRECVVGPEDARVGGSLAGDTAHNSIGESHFQRHICWHTGGFFRVNVDAPQDIYATLGKATVTNFRVEIYPVMSFDKLAEVFAMRNLCYRRSGVRPGSRCATYGI
jgi:hypothetical protein